MAMRSENGSNGVAMWLANEMTGISLNGQLISIMAIS